MYTNYVCSRLDADGEKSRLETCQIGATVVLQRLLEFRGET
jgi:hypothetical protein